MSSSFQTLLTKIIETENKLLGTKWLIFLLVAGNLFGAILGFNYYLNIIGIGNYHPILWIFIVDSPMATFLLLGFFLQGRNQRYHNFNLLAFVQGIRSPIFTYLFVFNFPSIDIELVIIGHTLLLLQTFLIIPQLSNLRINKGTGLVVLITLLNDFLDFFGFLSFIPPTLAQLPTIEPMLIVFMITILSLDILTLLIGINLHRKYHKNTLTITPSISQEMY
ncbi:MAG: DUF1405 domain-containing protein [Candidatus Kariarchaeaceae archaeon]|jgi:uncharacterized membrane protein YpjA